MRNRCRARRQVPGRELRGLGPAGIHHPHLAPAGEVANQRRGIRERLHVGVVGDDGVRAEEDRHRRTLEVDAVEEPSDSRHETAHDGIGGASIVPEVNLAGDPSPLSSRAPAQ